MMDRLEAYLRLALAPIRKPTRRRLLERCRAAERGVTAIFEDEALLSDVGLALADLNVPDERELRKQLEALRLANCGALGLSDAEHADAARGNRSFLPLYLFHRGSPSFLSKPAVGFCGSRKASDRGLDIARDCARQLAREGFNIVSGYAAGVDQAAHQTALHEGGSTTFVLAEGVLRFRVKSSIERVYSENRSIALSEFLPSAPWRPFRAMQRNSTICCLSDAMILVESQVNSGTLAAGREALKLGVPLFIVDFAESTALNEGNRELLATGARPLRRTRSGGANVAPILAAVQEGTKRKADRRAQLEIDRRATG